MEQLKLDTQSKVIYGLYHFFTPMVYVGIIASEIVEDPTFITLDEITPIICIFIAGLITSLYLLIQGISNYRKFIQIQDNTISVCTTLKKQEKTLETINIEDVKEIQNDSKRIALERIFGKLYLKTNEDKKIQVMNLSTSNLPILLTLPIFAIPFFIKRIIHFNIMTAQIKYSCGFITEEERDCILKKNDSFWANIFCWICLAVILFYGIWGLFMGIIISLLLLLT